MLSPKTTKERGGPHAGFEGCDLSLNVREAKSLSELLSANIVHLENGYDELVGRLLEVGIEWEEVLRRRDKILVVRAFWECLTDMRTLIKELYENSSFSLS